MISCNQKTAVDLIVHHAKIYTVDANFSMAEAFAEHYVGYAKEYLEADK